MHLVSWNVTSWARTVKLIRQWHGSLEAWLDRHQIDVLALQEVKTTKKKLSEDPKALGADLKAWDTFWTFCEKPESKGFNGVAVFARKGTTRRADGRALGDKDLDDEGRCLVTDHGSFVLVNVYVPCTTGGGGLPGGRKRRFVEALEKLVAKHRADGRPVVVCGDLNIARRTITDRHWSMRQIDLTKILEANGTAMRAGAGTGEACALSCARSDGRVDDDGAESLDKNKAGGLQEDQNVVSNSVVEDDANKGDPDTVAARTIRRAWPMLSAALATAEVASQTVLKAREKKVEKYRPQVTHPPRGEKSFLMHTCDKPEEAEAYVERLLALARAAEVPIGSSCEEPIEGGCDGDSKCSGDGRVKGETAEDWEQLTSVRYGASARIELLVEMLDKIAGVKTLTSTERLTPNDKVTEGLAFTPGFHVTTPFQSWLNRFLKTHGMVDSFSAVHPDAEGRFTCWWQYRNDRYRNVGSRIDYFLVPEDWTPDCLPGSLSTGPGSGRGVLGGDWHTEGSSKGALCAATAGGMFRQASFNGGGIEEATQRAYDDHFRAPHTGMIYTPPQYSDHIAVSLATCSELPRSQVLTTDRATKQCQPHRQQLSLVASFACVRTKGPMESNVEGRKKSTSKHGIKSGSSVRGVVSKRPAVDKSKTGTKKQRKPAPAAALSGLDKFLNKKK